MDAQLIAMILRALSIAATIPGVFGKNGEKLAPVLNTVASLAELPAETRASQQALLTQVNTWVAEGRGPTDEELETFKSTRDALDAQLREARAKLADAPTDGGL